MTTPRRSKIRACGACVLTGAVLGASVLSHAAASAATPRLAVAVRPGPSVTGAPSPVSVVLSDPAGAHLGPLAVADALPAGLHYVAGTGSVTADGRTHHVDPVVLPAADGGAGTLLVWDRLPATPTDGRRVTVRFEVRAALTGDLATRASVYPAPLPAGVAPGAGALASASGTVRSAPLGLAVSAAAAGSTGLETDTLQVDATPTGRTGDVTVRAYLPAGVTLVGCRPLPHCAAPSVSSARLPYRTGPSGLPVVPDATVAPPLPARTAPVAPVPRATPSGPAAVPTGASGSTTSASATSSNATSSSATSSSATSSGATSSSATSSGATPGAAAGTGTAPAAVATTTPPATSSPATTPPATTPPATTPPATTPPPTAPSAPATVAAGSADRAATAAVRRHRFTVLTWRIGSLRPGGHARLSYTVRFARAATEPAAGLVVATGTTSSDPAAAAEIVTTESVASWPAPDFPRPAPLVALTSGGVIHGTSRSASSNRDPFPSSTSTTTTAPPAATTPTTSAGSTRSRTTSTTTHTGGVTTGTTTSSKPLAYTGIDTGGPLLAAGGLVALGAALVGTTRRRLQPALADPGDPAGFGPPPDDGDGDKDDDLARLTHAAVAWLPAPPSGAETYPGWPEGTEPFDLAGVVPAPLAAQTLSWPELLAAGGPLDWDAPLADGELLGATGPGDEPAGDEDPILGEMGALDAGLTRWVLVEAPERAVPFDVGGLVPSRGPAGVGAVGGLAPATDAGEALPPPGPPVAGAAEPARDPAGEEREPAVYPTGSATVVVDDDALRAPGGPVARTDDGPALDALLEQVVVELPAHVRLNPEGRRRHGHAPAPTGA